MPDRLLKASPDALVWRTLQTVGMIFFLIGLLDLVFSLVPNQLGEPEWELGTTSHFFDVVPLLGLGVTFLLAAGLAAGRRWQVRTVATFAVLLAVFMLLAMLLYATVVPLAFKVITEPVALTTIKKAALKTGIQALLYPFAMLWLGGAGWKASFGRRRG